MTIKTILNTDNFSALSKLNTTESAKGIHNILNQVDTFMADAATYTPSQIADTIKWLSAYASARQLGYDSSSIFTTKDQQLTFTKKLLAHATTLIKSNQLPPKQLCEALNSTELCLKRLVEGGGLAIKLCNPSPDDSAQEKFFSHSILSVPTNRELANSPEFMGIIDNVTDNFLYLITHPALSPTNSINTLKNIKGLSESYTNVDRFMASAPDGRGYNFTTTLLQHLIALEKNTPDPSAQTAITDTIKQLVNTPCYQKYLKTPGPDQTKPTYTALLDDHLLAIYTTTKTEVAYELTDDLEASDTGHIKRTQGVLLFNANKNTITPNSCTENIMQKIIHPDHFTFHINTLNALKNNGDDITNEPPLKDAQRIDHLCNLAIQVGASIVMAQPADQRVINRDNLIKTGATQLLIPLNEIALAGLN